MDSRMYINDYFKKEAGFSTHVAYVCMYLTNE